MKTIIATDGAARGNGQSDSLGAWAFSVWQNNEHIEEFGASIRGVTNNHMELKALLEALKWLKDKPEIKDVEFIIDSGYVVNSIVKQWAYNWRKVNYIVKKNPVTYRPNHLLWIETLELLDYFKENDVKIYYTHVAGHSGNKYNDAVDLLCNRCMDNHV